MMNFPTLVKVLGRTAAAALLAASGIAGCSVQDNASAPAAEAAEGKNVGAISGEEQPPPAAETESGVSAREGDAESDGQEETQFIDLGTGRFVGTLVKAEKPSEGEDPVTLNFENTELSSAVRVILGDLLGQNYVISPSVQGVVTLQTNRQIERENLLPTLEMLLRMNDAAVVRHRDLYHVVPRDRAAVGTLTPQLGDSDAPLPPGYTIRIVPVNHVSATEISEILESFAPAGSVVRVDTARNFLLLAGTTVELDSLAETVRIFDVDWLKGMSFGLFTPDFVDASTLAGELGNIFGKAAKGPLAGMIRLVPIERLDALLVVSPRPEYLSRVAEWIDRLDRDTDDGGEQLFVYRVQNGKAADLAAVLDKVFEEDQESATRQPARLAPGLEPVEIRSDESETSEGLIQGLAIGGGGGSIRIIADKTNNVLLIRATARQYRQVAKALQKIDALPLQVHIEATIAEVSLTDRLSLGVEWFFKNSGSSADGVATLDLGDAGLTPNIGLSYVIRRAGDVRFVLNALAGESNLDIISSPSLMVLNHQEASIQVGDQVPVTTQRQQATSTEANIVNNIEFRDTGVLLTIRPRVNSGGLVVMEIEQEVSDVAEGSGGSLTPTIQQRKIRSTVAVQSGETIVLGGLMRETKNETQSGVPGLSQIPVLGALFRSSSDTVRRTELVVLITPRAVQDPAVARGITEEMRRRVRNLRSLPAPPADAPSSEE